MALEVNSGSSGDSPLLINLYLVLYYWPLMLTVPPVVIVHYKLILFSALLLTLEVNNGTNGDSPLLINLYLVLYYWPLRLTVVIVHY